MRLDIASVRNLEPRQKIRSFDEMPGLIRSLGRAGMTVVLAQGVFDIFHVGHVGYLRAARRIDPASSVVVVGVENDETVQRNKGNRRPVNPLADRLLLLSELVSVALTFGYDDVPRYDCPEDYVDRYRTLCPATIAAADWDPHLQLKRWQASQAGTRIAAVDYRHENSTTRMLRLVGYEE